MENIFKVYTKWLIILFIAIILINVVFNKYINIISFTNMFLILIPNWIYTLYIYLKTNNNNKDNLVSYMEKTYPDILKDFYNNYVNHSNPESKPIFALFLNSELLKDDYINAIKINLNQAIMLFVCTSGLTIMAFLISTVFIVKAIYFQ